MTTQAARGTLAKPRKLLRLLGRSRYRRALRGGVAAAVEHESVPFGHAFRTIIDVGAHHGQFALVASERFPEARLICVEPQPDAVRVLRACPLNHAQLTIIEVAAAESAGPVEMQVSGRTDSSSLLEIGDDQVAAFPHTGEVGRIRVPAAPLDELIDPETVVRPCLLKVDVQGGELGALRGAEKLLARVDELFVECSFRELYVGQPLVGDVIEHLAEVGFTLEGVFSLVRDRSGGCIQGDWLFSSSAGASSA